MPLVEALAAYAAAGRARFHVPGHKGRPAAWGEPGHPLKAGSPPDPPAAGSPGAWGAGAAGTPPAAPWLAGVLPWDVTEVAGLDDLHAPAGAIAEAEALAAALWGAAETCFLVNGTSVGLMACLLAAAGTPGARAGDMAAGDAPVVLVPRLAHRSVAAGLVLSGAEPVFYRVDVDPATGLALPPRPAAVAEALGRATAGSRTPAAAVFTHPTYHGLTGDLAGCVGLAREAGVPAIADEAHGPHFGFGPAFPPSALACGADAAVQSAHKTLGALTQASYLHLAPARPGREAGRLQPAGVRAMLRLLQTTSPSYLLLASLDAARWAMAHGGAERWARAAALAGEARTALDAGPVRAWHPPAPGVAADPTRLVLDAAGAGLTGWALADALRARGVELETADAATALAVVTAADAPEAVGRLVDAVRQVASELPGRPVTGTGGRWTAADTRALVSLAAELGGAWPEPVLSPRAAALAEREAVPLDRAAGRVAAEAVSPYPPGAPVVWPGEPFTAAAVDFLRLLRRAGGRAHGAIGNLDAVWAVRRVRRSRLRQPRGVTR